MCAGIKRAAFEVTSSLQSYKEICEILLGISATRGDDMSDFVAGEAHYTFQVKGKSVIKAFKPKHSVAAVFCMACGSRDHHTSACTKATIHKDASGKYPLNCFHCYKPGHFKWECPELSKTGAGGAGGHSA